MRQIELFIRAYYDGVAFRFKLFRSGKVGDRQITKELTTFNIPGDPKAWIVEYGGFSSANEAEFIEHPLSYLNEKSIAGMPMLMDYGNNCWVAITEAKINNYAAFYIGTNGTINQLTTKLVPVPGEPETGVKVRFADEVYTPWRVLMIGETPGWPSNILLISSEPSADGKYCTVHLREINGKNTSLQLINGLNGKDLPAIEVDATGKPVSNPSLNIDPLESKFYRIIFVP